MEKKQNHAVTLLDANRCIDKARRPVTDRTIQHCFRHAGILSAQGIKTSHDMTSKLKLPPLLLMICLYPNGCEELIVMF
jgi:hypothetical protein